MNKEYLEYKTKRSHKFSEFWSEGNKIFIREGGLKIEENTIVKEFQTQKKAENKVSELYEKLLNKGYETPIIKLDLLLSLGVLGLEKLNNANDEIKKKILQINGSAIEYLSSPSDELKQVAIQSNGSALKFIKNPSDFLKIEAIKSNAMALKFISNQTEEMKNFVLKSDKIYFAHRYIENPTKKMIVSFLQKGISLRDINRYYTIEDLTTAIDAINAKKSNYSYLPDCYKNDKNVVKQLLILNSKNIRDVESSFRNNLAFLKDVLAERKFMPYDYFLQDIGSEVQENKEFVIEVVSKNGLTLECASSNFKEDKEVIVAATNQNINALLFVKKKCSN